MGGKDEKEIMQALNDFLSDPDLRRLEELTSEVNFFDIMKITRMEIRHSNMLAWLLDPNENHGLGDKTLKGFITLAAKHKKKHDRSFDPSFIAQMDHSSFSLFREWCNIDILAVSQSEKFVLCIENTIDSGEHGNQLETYINRVERTYRDYQKLFVYLSPDGRESSDTERWLSMSYWDVVNVIENALSDSAISAEAKLIIDNYLKTVRRDILGNKDIKDLCTEIYQKHKKAIDLIIENRPDTLELVRDIIIDWAQKKAQEGTIRFGPETPISLISNTYYIRFQTDFMSGIMPDADNAYSAWNTHSYYYYEIADSNGSSISMQLTINSQNIPDDLRIMSDVINEYSAETDNRTVWNYRRPKHTPEYIVPGDLSSEDICRDLDSMLNDIFAFEEELKKKLSKQ